MTPEDIWKQLEAERAVDESRIFRAEVERVKKESKVLPTEWSSKTMSESGISFITFKEDRPDDDVHPGHEHLVPPPTLIEAVADASLDRRSGQEGDSGGQSRHFF